jgi:thymidylate synthase (FAD)
VSALVVRSDMVVRLVDAMGDDLSILEDARTSIRRPGRAVSESAGRELSDGQKARLEDFFRLRHASVLRGCVLKVEVEVPIFVQRQLRTHWVGMAQGWSENDWLGFNDQSARYSRQAPQVWVPRVVRTEVVGFDPMAPDFELLEDEDGEPHQNAMAQAYEVAIGTYQRLIAAGVAREQARAVLPEGLYVAGRITGNLNAWFGLMSLRIDHPDNTVQTHPQWEVQVVAEQVECLVRDRWPAAHAAWRAAGRVRP